MSFQIVSIRPDKKNFKTKSHVIVPVDYVTTNGQFLSYVRYLPPPYSEECKQTIRDLVSSKSKTPEGWGSFKCDVKALTGKQSILYYYLQNLKLYS